jgi:hypothetical protein
MNIDILLYTAIIIATGLIFGKIALKKAGEISLTA